MTTTTNTSSLASDSIARLLGPLAASALFSLVGCSGATDVSISPVLSTAAAAPASAPAFPPVQFFGEEFGAAERAVQAKDAETPASTF